MLSPSDLMVLGTRYYHESGVPSCTLLHQRNTFLKTSPIQGLSSTSERRSGFGKVAPGGGRWERRSTMQRVVSSHTALKFNQFLSTSAHACHGWRSLGFSRSFALQPMDSPPVRPLTGNSARVLSSLPGYSSGGNSIEVINSSVPRVRPAVVRRSFRESRKLLTRRARQGNTSSRIGSAGDFSPQRLLECAVDVLRNFNEKVNNLFQPGGDSGARDFTSAAEEMVLTSPDNNAGAENGALELVADDVVFEQQQRRPGSEFEWRSALWETEISSVEELEVATQSGEADVEIRAADKVEEALVEAITADRELEHPENVDVVRIAEGSDGEPSTERKEVDIGELWNINNSGHSSLAGLEPFTSRDLRPWGSGVVDSVPPIALDGDMDGQGAVLEDQVGQSVGSEPSSILEPQGPSSLVHVDFEKVQPCIGERDDDVQIESSDPKSQSEVLAKQSSASDPHLGSALANAEIEAVQSSTHQTHDGMGAESYRVEELAEPRPRSERSPTLEPQAMSSTGSVECEVGESSEGLSLGNDVHKISSLGSTEGGEVLSVEGQVFTEDSTFVDKRGKTEHASEEEIVPNGSPTDGLLRHDSSWEARELSYGGQTVAGEAFFMEVKPVSPVRELSSEKFGELLREQDTEDAEVASERQTQADLTTGSDLSTARSMGGMDDLQQEISRLRNSVGHHAYLYHTLDSPVISDAAYDSLVKELEYLETQVSNFEPTPNLLVAAQLSADMLKIVHSVSMLSLASVQKEEEALLWHQNLQQKLGLEKGTFGWVVEPKVDGLALSLRYENGNLKWAATRGDGIQGEDVTHNARRVVGIPLAIPQRLPRTESPLTVLEVRGEIFMSLKDFKEWNASKIQSGEKPMANPRNAAAGSMRLLSSNATDVRPLGFMAYSIAVIEVGAEEDLERSSAVPKSQWEALQLLKSVGFTVNEDNQLLESFDSALEYAKSWRSTRKILKYEADGVVLKVNDLRIQASLGSTGADPRWALAWKFSATEAVSVLEGIELTIGRSGAMIPNARFKSVELGGVTVSRASLHNFGHVKALGLCEGDHIVVQRAGDVIPQVVQVLEDMRPETAKPWLPPQECPACGSTLSEISASAMVFCSNSTCPSRHSRQVAHFAKTLISGLGAATLSRLEEELVKDPAEFYDLDEKALSKVKGFGKQSAKKLLKAIEESKHQEVWLFIAALGIPRVGASTAKDLAEKFRSIQTLLKSNLSGFMDVPGIGAATAQCIFDWFQSEVNIELVHRLEAAGCQINGNQVTETQGEPDGKEDDVTKESEGEPDVVGEDIESVSQANVSARKPDAVEDVEDVIETHESGETSDNMKMGDEALVDATLQPTDPVLSGKSIVITGEFGTIKREDLKKLVNLHGGVVRISVTSRTSFVVYGNRPGPLKVAEASRRGIEMVDLQSFLRLIGQTERYCIID